MKISSLSFKNFKTFRDKESFAEIKDVNFIIGPNGVGKTNVRIGLETIKKMFYGSQMPAQSSFDKNDEEAVLSITFKLTKNERRQILVSVNMDPTDNSEKYLQYVMYSVWHEANTKIRESISVDSIHGGFREGIVLIYNGNTPQFQTSDLHKIITNVSTSDMGSVNSNVNNMGTALKQYNLPILELFEKAFEKIVHVPSQRMFASTASPQEQQKISPDGNSLLNELHTSFQNSRGKRDSYEQSVKRVTPHIKEINTPIKGSKITIEIREDGLVNPIKHDELSNGCHQSLILTNIIQNSSPKIIFLEEPELHLHAKSQKELLCLIRENNEHQFFIETHSPIFTGLSESETTFLISKNKGASSVLTISSDNIAQIKYQLGLAHSDIYEHDFVCFVEGESEREAFSIIAQRAKHKSEYKFRVWALKGYGNLKNIKTLLEYLKGGDRKIFAIVDKNRDAEAIINEWIREGLIEEQNTLMLSKNFEDEFSSKEIIAAVQKLVEKYHLKFKLTENELEERRKNDAVDKILKEMLQPEFNLKKPELARDLASNVDLENPNKNEFVKHVMEILEKIDKNG